MLRAGKHPARKPQAGADRVAAAARVRNDDLAVSIGVGGSRVYRTERRLVDGNLPAALSGQPRPGAERSISGREEALLVATACSKPPQRWARGHWSYRPTP